MTDYDVVVVGGGMAALTAGLFSTRQGRSTLVLEPAIPGGHLTNVPKIEDFPGFPDGVSGFELGPNTQLQAMNAGAEFSMAEVTALAPADNAWLVTTTDGEHRARAVIVAAGSHARALGVPGEEQFEGRGISHCASCDGPLYRDKTVGVVGGGDSAVSEALVLAEYVGQVLVLHRGETFRAQHTYLQRAQEHSKIALRTNAVVEEILGEDGVSGVRVHDVATGKTAQIDLACLFVYIGIEPNTGFLKDVLDLDEQGRIPTDIWMHTVRPGLFAAGDIRRDSAAQAITAAGDGATAAIAAHRYLEDGAWPGS
ncbi:MAG: FAD-dependent oxidoreductase [Chloroflexi bacterium]|nr:FAD-dependent oxidoreductase [Chloroflexota bacterium]